MVLSATSTAWEKRQEAVRLIKSRKGKNSYTQGSKRNYVFGYPEGKNPGYGDCSGTVREIIKRVAGIDIGSNTSAQIDNRKRGIVIEMANGKASPTESLMQPGDCVYYKGNTAHTWDVGHVEMYVGGGKLYGHGSGMGPSEHDLVGYSKKRTGKKAYLCVIRWIKDDSDTPITNGALGSRILRNGDYGEDVKELQRHLKALAYFGGSIGGNYLTLTTAAVKSFQKAYALTVDGEYGPKSHAKLMALVDGNGIAPAPPTSQQKVVTVTGGKAWVRSTPDASKTTNRVGDVREGDEFIYLGETSANGWHKIEYKGGAEWITGKYSKVA